MNLRSRIHEKIPPELLYKLDDICNSKLTSDNNKKADMVLQALNEFKIDFVELGPGTNRFAILIDNYVYKIALDKWGKLDNANEFSMTSELQPYVIKVYNCNDLIAVTEYVTVISREEFAEKKEEILEILGVLSESYLLGDVGYVSKNFMNWGYRDNGELVILDFAYIYRVRGHELRCSCGQVIGYDKDFHNLICFKCGRKYSFTDIRRKISMDEENANIEMTKQLAFKLTQPITIINQSSEEQNNNPKNQEEIFEEEIEMGKKMKIKTISNNDSMDAYLEALEMFGQNEDKDNSCCECNKTSEITDSIIDDYFSEYRQGNVPTEINTENITLVGVDVAYENADRTTECELDINEIVELETNTDFNYTQEPANPMIKFPEEPENKNSSVRVIPANCDNDETPEPEEENIVTESDCGPAIDDEDDDDEFSDVESDLYKQLADELGDDESDD
jgi:hypothetical protein